MSDTLLWGTTKPKSPKVNRHVSNPSVLYEISSKLPLRVCKTSASYETSSKSHASSLQNERFVRDFFQKSHVNENRTSIPQTAPATKSDNIVSYELHQNLHHTTRLEPVLSTLPSTKIVISAERARKPSFDATPSNANPNVTATSNTPKTPLSKRQSQCDCAENCQSHKTLRLRSELILHTSTSYVSTRFLAISHNQIYTSRFHAKPLQNLPPMAAALASSRTAAKRRRTAADGTRREQGSTPRPPELNENPSLRIR